MSKENPYFKFYTSEWLNGRITLEEYELQGLFINLCAYYWHSHGEVTKEQANKKFKNPIGFDLLLKENLIALSGEKLVIVFLDEQLEQRGVQSIINRANGNKGGRPKKTHLVNLENRNESESKPIDNKSNSNNNSNKEIRKVFAKPPLHEIISFFVVKTENNWNKAFAQNEAQKFFNFYESNGWKVGKNPMKDWSAAANNWIARNNKDNPQPQQKRILS